MSLKIIFILPNSVDPDVTAHPLAFHLGLHSLPKYPFTGFSTKRVRLVCIMTAKDEQFDDIFHC